MCHRLKVFIIVTKQQGPRHRSKFLTSATIKVLIIHYIITLKIYEPQQKKQK